MPRPLAFALAATAALVWGYGAIDPVEHFGSGIMYYWPMADAAPRLDLGQPQPYVFRWLGPWLAGVLPGPSPGGFYALVVAGSMALAGLMWAVLRADGRSERAAALTVVLLAANPYLFGFNVFNHFHLDDVLAQLALGAALLALARGRYALMGAVLAVGVLAREPAVLFVPVAAVWLWERGRLRADGLRVALALVPVAVLFLAPRLAFPAVGGPSLVQTFGNASGKAAEPITWFRLLVNAWAPSVALVPVWPRETLQAMRGRLHLVALGGLVLASAFFGGDQERLMQPAIWAVYPFVALLVERHIAGRRVAEALLLAAAVLTSLHHLTARFPLPSKALKGALTVVGLLVVLAVALWQRRMEAATRSA